MAVRQPSSWAVPIGSARLNTKETCCAEIHRCRLRCLPSDRSASHRQVGGTTYDGTWDCRDGKAGYLGAIVIANLSYAFIDPAGKVSEYGTLESVGKADQHFASQIVLDGPLQTGFGVITLIMLGPIDNSEDASHEVYLYAFKTETAMFQCIRRYGVQLLICGEQSE